MVYRPKYGLNVPLEEWMVTKFIDYTESVLPDDTSVNRGFIRKDYF